MLLSDLIRDLPITVHGSADVRISGVTEDSRRVEPGWLFVARPGTKHDGGAFVAQAVERGAVAVLAEIRFPDSRWPGGRLPDSKWPDSRFGRNLDTPNLLSGDLPSGNLCGGAAAPTTLVCDEPARLGAILAERWYGSPSSRLGLVGVTGTNGKTTVSWLLRQLMNAGGRTCGMIGTIEIDEGAGARPADLTTPMAEDVSASLARMVVYGCGAAVMEVSSHALDQRRAAGLAFRAAVFTNLSGDHLDYHGSMDAYAAAKARLFENLTPGALAIVNVDDPAGERMLRGCRSRVLRCSMLGDGDATVRVVAEGLESRITMAGPWGDVSALLSLVGDHNAMNALQAVAAAHELGLSREAIEAALPALMPPPGRLEPVVVEGVEGPRVLVDYAHTDDALEKALTAVAGRTGDGKLWVVFGCGGDRDRTKRPRMGAVAGRLADRVVVTSDNPRTEEPQSIVDQVHAGVPEGAWTASDVDREAAIHLAILQADARDVVVIAGKGHEDYQIISDGKGGTVKRDFDDRVVARAALRKRAGVAGGVR